jgi:hypothetical protein
LQDLKRNKSFLPRLCSELWHPNLTLIAPFAHMLSSRCYVLPCIYAHAPSVSKESVPFELYFTGLATVWFCISHCLLIFSCVPSMNRRGLHAIIRKVNMIP